MIWKLAENESFKAPPCRKCGSMRTFTQSTKQLPPMTQHNCKCRNCEANWKEFSQRIKPELLPHT